MSGILKTKEMMLLIGTENKILVNFDWYDLEDLIKNIQIAKNELNFAREIAVIIHPILQKAYITQATNNDFIVFFDRLLALVPPDIKSEFVQLLVSLPIATRYCEIALIEYWLVKNRPAVNALIASRLFKLAGDTEKARNRGQKLIDDCYQEELAKIESYFTKYKCQGDVCKSLVSILQKQSDEILRQARGEIDQLYYEVIEIASSPLNDLIETERCKYQKLIRQHE